jgi:hypothetical protein
LKAVSFDGMKLAWQEGWKLHVSTVADLVAGKAPVTFSDVDVVWAAFDERGVLYAHEGIELVTFDARSGERSVVDGATSAKTLVSWEGGLVSAAWLVRGGELTPLETRPWLRAIDGTIEDDRTFTLDTAASHGAILCVGPAAYDNPHLCFVDLEGNLLALRKRPARGSFWLFSLGNELVTVGDRDKKVIISPWPSVGA